MKLPINLKYIPLTIVILVFISGLWIIVSQYQQIQAFKQEQIQNNNLISSQSIEEPVLDGLKPQIINIKGKKQTLYLPEQFTISVLSEGFKSPQFIKSDDNGNIFVTDSESNSLWIVNNSNPQEPKVVDTKLNGIMSLDWYQGKLYIATDNKVIVYQDIKSDGSYIDRKTLIENLPTPPKNKYNTIKIRKDRIYIGIPAKCETCIPKDKRLGSILSYTLDGEDEQLFAKGLKEITDISSLEEQLLVTDIGRIGISNQLPAVELNSITEGKDYGWPYCYGQSNVDPKYTEQSDFCKNKVESAISELPKGVGVSAIAKIPAQFFNDFKDKYAISYQGGTIKGVKKGYKIVIKDINKNSVAKNIVTGWLLDHGDVWGVPTGIAFDNKGAMIISDSKNGILYKLTKK